MGRILAIAALLVLAACATGPQQPAATSTLTNEAATLGSLSLVDDYPLYTMRYVGSYGGQVDHAGIPQPLAALDFPSQGTCSAAWGCSLFAALANDNDRLLGRNFDWEFSPAVLLFTDPIDAYASVSMVDIAYLGFEGERSRQLADLSLEERKPLLNAPYLPFDGMNEKGIAVGMAAIPAQPMPYDPQHETIDELRAIREILDHAATVDEAIAILDGHNIDMGSVPIHYLIVSAAGESALVEFYQGNMVVFRNEQDWQTATNFLVASTDGHPQGQCWRYDAISQRLQELQGRIAVPEAIQLLKTVSQDSTQWSVIYHVTSGDVEVVMGRGYSKAAHTFHLDPSAR